VRRAQAIAGDHVYEREAAYQFLGRACWIYWALMALNDESTLISAGLQRQRGWLVYRESPESAL